MQSSQASHARTSSLWRCIWSLNAPAWSSATGPWTPFAAHDRSMQAFGKRSSQPATACLTGGEYEGRTRES
jgi:hypothetical protein